MGTSLDPAGEVKKGLVYAPAASGRRIRIPGWRSARTCWLWPPAGWVSNRNWEVGLFCACRLRRPARLAGRLEPGPSQKRLPSPRVSCGLGPTCWL